MKYYVVGYMYSGKSTFGRALAKQLGLRFIDLDALFEQRYHYTVSRFFATFGEEAFRQLERQVLHSTAAIDNAVVATGGGTPCYFDNMQFILAHGTAVYLRMSRADLVRRAVASHNPRPAMRGLTPTEVEQKVAAQLLVREPYYQQAHITLDGNAPDMQSIVGQQAQ